MRSPSSAVRLTGLLLAAAATACAPPAAGPGVVDVVQLQPDPGAAARTEVLARYADGVAQVAAEVPSIVGHSPAAAEALLADHGLSLRLVAFDRRQPVTEQHPPAGQPVPLDGVVEGWLGRPPQDEATDAPATAEVAEAAGPGEAAPVPTPTAQPAATTDAPAPPAAAGPRYVLPPHTAGLLRTNPRRLPAVPLGTELTGLASWYGPGFHGLTTACGGRYDQNGATLATRELRCGTVVRITGPTGRTVEATVTDWGPAEWTGRRFDLSAAVFNAIAPLGSGVVPVRVVTANVPG